MFLNGLRTEYNMVYNTKKDIIGNWESMLKIGNIELPLVFTINEDNKATLKASLISQGSTIPANSIKYISPDLSIEFTNIAGSFAGKFDNSSDSIFGEWKQGNQEFKIRLKRGENILEKTRPQEPHAPFPYLVDDVSYQNRSANITLGGTLTIPAQDLPSPAVILISGSGALDRNETAFGHKPFLVLADYLTRRGIAVLRVDDRGVGDSTGNYFESTNSDYASDVKSGIKYLRTRKEIDYEKIGLIGHSEGGVIAPIVAIDNPDVAFIVLMAGPGLTLEEILYKQAELIARAENLDEHIIKKERKIQEIMFSIIKNEKNIKQAEIKIRQTINDELKDLKDKNMPFTSQNSIDSQIKHVLSPWFRDFLTYNPKIALSNVKCPILALNGGKDLQVPPKENLTAINHALNEGGNLNYKTIEIPGLNHIFQTAKTGSVSEYAQIDETMAPEALKLIGDWIIEQVQELKISGVALNN